MRLGANVIYVACFVFYYVHALVTLINDLLTYLHTYIGLQGETMLFVYYKYSLSFVCSVYLFRTCNI